MDQQIQHCLEQVARFSLMLHTGDQSRPRDAMLAQLAFNWGRYVELARVDGRAHWQTLEKLVSAGNFTELRELALGLLARA